MLEENDWLPVEDQGEFGAEVTFGRDYWPVQIATDALISSDENDALGINIVGLMSELGPGVRKVRAPGRTRPYPVGGQALVYGKRERPHEEAGRKLLVRRVEVEHGVDEVDAGTGGDAHGARLRP